MTAELDLAAIEARWREATGHAWLDMKVGEVAALLAEVRRLRAEVERLRCRKSVASLVKQHGLAENSETTDFEDR